jgi:glycerol-3-phosphate cytidylyltransferase
MDGNRNGHAVRKVITYGTFDLFHLGHLRLLERARALGTHLTVAVSTEEFNASKGKVATCPFGERLAIVGGLSVVDAVISEESWDQKRRDIVDHGIEVFVMGSDWDGEFDELRDLCEVVYLPRTPGFSTRERVAAIRSTSALDE